MVQIMRMKVDDFVVDGRFKRAIREAGKILVRGQAADLRIIEKAGGSSTTDADLHSQRLLVEFFHRRYPTLPLLVEEEQVPAAKTSLEKEFPGLKLLSANDENRTLPRSYVSIDPADGTAFLENGSPEFAVSAAIIDGGIPIAGAVYQPCHDVLYAAPVQGVTLSDISRRDRPLNKSLKNAMAHSRFRVFCIARSSLARCSHWSWW
jgi:3'-phosphoadenosine 5'-phosphosulfate (PAPS) 3'-phosphatase